MFENIAPWPCFRAFPPVCWNTLKRDIYNTYICVNIWREGERGGERAALQHNSRKYRSHLFHTKDAPRRFGIWQYCLYRTVRHKVEGIGTCEWALRKEFMT